MRFSPGCSCCGDFIGWENASSLDVVECSEEWKHLTFLSSNPANIGKCDVIFAGPSNTCGGLTFAQSAWEQLREWLEAGGRMYLAGEYQGCLNIIEKAEMHDFLEALGSTMRLGSVVLDNNCSTTAHPGTVANIPLTEGLTTLHHAAVNSITGGTAVAFTHEQPSTVWAAIEQIGDGYLLLVADSNVTGGCGYDNCQFFKNFIDKEELL